MKYYKETQFENCTYVIRSLEEKDVESIVDYWMNGDKSIFEKMGIDLAHFPTREDRTKFFSSLISNDPLKGEAHLIVGVYKESIVGYALFNHIHTGVDCQGHLHVINPEFRKKGITPRLVVDNMKAVWDFLNIKTMIYEPSAHNSPINRMLNKCLMFPKRTYLKPAQGICREMMVNQYCVHRRYVIAAQYYFRAKISLENLWGSLKMPAINRAE